MIVTKEIKISKKCNIDYIESELKKRGYDVLRWAITGYDTENYTVNIAVLE